MDPLVAIECSSEAVRVDDSYEDLSSKTDLGVIKTVSRHFLDPIEIVFIYSRSGRPRAIKWDRRVMKASENILSTTYFASDGCQSAFANFHKIWTTCLHLLSSEIIERWWSLKIFYQLLTLYPMAAKVLLQIFIKYDWHTFNWLYQLLWMAQKWFEHFESKIDFHFILLKKEIIEW